MSFRRAVNFRFPSVRRVFAVGVVVLSIAAACGEADVPGAETAPANGAAGATTGASSDVAAAAFPQSATGISPSDSVLMSRADKGRLMGNDSAAIWVVMISDFQCPYCKQWHDESMENLKRDYIATGKVRFAYLHLPLSIHPFARAEAEAAMCASAEGKFWPFADQLFTRQKEISALPDVQPALTSIARKLGIDSAGFAQCQQSPAIRSLVSSDEQQANTARIQSTPSFLVGDFLVQGALPYADFRHAIDTALVVARTAKRPR